MMSIYQMVETNLPFIRRYARALTGSQESGDRYVAAMLETLISEPDLVGGDNPTRLDLFRVFSKIWNSLAINQDADPVALKPAERRLNQIGALPRQAFLLVTLENFSEHEAGEILGLGPNEIRNLIDQSGRELADQIATNVLIIEDEAVIALDLQELVESLGHEVQGVARTHKEAVSLATQRKPGLILADIQLADGSSGIDAVNELLKGFEVPVIFITAFPERYLTGIRPEPTFLITKPYQPAMVSAIISQALFFDRKATNNKERHAAV